MFRVGRLTRVHLWRKEVCPMDRGERFSSVLILELNK